MVFGFIKIGKLIDCIPHSVVSGFMSGIGVIIIIGQRYSLFRVNTSFELLANNSSHVGDLFNGVNWWSLLLAVMTLAVIYILPRFTKIIPSSLAALIPDYAFCQLCFLPEKSVELIGNIPTGIPVPHLGEIARFDWLNLNIWMSMLPVALTLAALASLDSLLTSVVADNLTKTKHDSNKEIDFSRTRKHGFWIFWWSSWGWSLG